MPAKLTQQLNFFCQSSYTAGCVRPGAGLSLADLQRDATSNGVPLSVCSGVAIWQHVPDSTRKHEGGCRSQMCLRPAWRVGTARFRNLYVT